MTLAADNVVAVWRDEAGETLVFQQVRGPDIVACWPALRPFIDKACAQSRGRFNPHWVAQRIGQGVDYLWALVASDGQPRGFATTHLGDYPTGLRVVEMVMIGGAGVGRRAARNCMKAISVYAQQQGCHRLEWQGRPGLSRWAGIAARPFGVICEVG